MDLQYCIGAAEEFARIIWPFRKDIGIKDLMIYGSVAEERPDPKDLDILTIHRNLKLDRFQDKLRTRKFQSDTEALKYLSIVLGIDLPKLFSDSKIRILIAQNLFHTTYISNFYFTNPGYREEWDKQNNSNFARDIFLQGKLWNPETEKYDFPARTRYRINDLSTDP